MPPTCITGETRKADGIPPPLVQAQPPGNGRALMGKPKKEVFIMDITKQVALSLDEIMALRSSIRARIRELDRINGRYDNLLLWSNKSELETLYDRLGKELDCI